jgi:hypothetical protein
MRSCRGTNLHDTPHDLRLPEVPLVNVDGGHGAVCGLQPDAVALGVKTLAGGLVLDQDDDDLAGPSARRLLDEDEVAVEDAVFDHGIAADAQRKDLPPAAEQDLVDANPVFGVFDGENRRPRGDPSEDRDVDEVVVGGTFERDDVRLGFDVAADRANGPALEVVTGQETLALEGFEMVVDAVRGADAHVLADLADRRRIAATLDGRADVVENLLLPTREALHGAHSTERTFMYGRFVLNVRADCQLF